MAARRSSHLAMGSPIANSRTPIGGTPGGEALIEPTNTYTNARGPASYSGVEARSAIVSRRDAQKPVPRGGERPARVTKAKHAPRIDPSASGDGSAQS